MEAIIVFNKTNKIGTQYRPFLESLKFQSFGMTNSGGADQKIKIIDKKHFETQHLTVKNNKLKS
jgi:hypothetical protein